jgi:hypothetical protein
MDRFSRIATVLSFLRACNFMQDIPQTTTNCHQSVLTTIAQVLVEVTVATAIIVVAAAVVAVVLLALA